MTPGPQRGPRPPRTPRSAENRGRRPRPAGPVEPARPAAGGPEDSRERGDPPSGRATAALQPLVGRAAAVSDTWALYLKNLRLDGEDGLFSGYLPTYPFFLLTSAS